MNGVITFNNFDKERPYVFEVREIYGTFLAVVISKKKHIALKASSDWLLKLARFAPENIVIVAGINELKSSFYAILSHCFGVI